MNNNAGIRPATGASSILMILIILCLTVFAVLSFVSANADYKLTQRANAAVKAYYEAENRAQGTLSQIDAGLAALRTEAGRVLAGNGDLSDAAQEIISSALSEQEKLNRLYRILVTEGFPEDITVSQDGTLLSFEQTVDEHRTLCFEVGVNDISQNARYTVRSTKVISSSGQEEWPDIWDGSGVEAPLK